MLMRLFAFAIIFLLPLVPTWLVHNRIKGRNVSQIKIVNIGAKLAGPAATYAALLLLGIYIYLRLPENDYETYTLTVKIADSAQREKLYSDCRKGLLGFRLEPANEEPIKPTVTEDEFGLILTFHLPNRLVGQRVLLATGGENLYFSDNPVELRGTSQTVSWTPLKIQPGSKLDQIQLLPGRYVVYDGSMATSNGAGGCTNEDWDGKGKGPSVPTKVEVIITPAPEENDLLLTMGNLGGAQLGGLSYQLKFVGSDGNHFLYQSGVAPAGWHVSCGIDSFTIKASSSGRVRFDVLPSGEVLLTGDVLLSSDFPACQSYCATTYRDIYHFDHRKPAVSAQGIPLAARRGV
jgi:hypothetical protein